MSIYTRPGLLTRDRIRYDSTYTIVNSNSSTTWDSTSDVQYLSAQIDNITIPTPVVSASELINDVGFITGVDLSPYALSSTVEMHIGDSLIHFTQEDISISASQVLDFPDDLSDFNNDVGFITGMDGRFDVIDSVDVDYSPINYNIQTNDVSGHFNGVDNKIFDIEESSLWELDSNTITPKDSENTLTLPYLSGDDKVIIADTDGTIKESNVTIYDGVTGGSILNLDSFATDPPLVDLIEGDMWVTDSPATSSKFLKMYDGLHKYSVELSLEE